MACSRFSLSSGPLPGTPELQHERTEIKITDNQALSRSFANPHTITMTGKQQGALHQNLHVVAPQDPTMTTATSSTSIPRSTNTRKSVGFVSRITFRKHISRRDMTPEEIQAAWYSREECATITKSCCKQIHMLNQGERLRDTKYCARGLESHTRISLAAKLQNRTDAFRAVLIEQDNQLTGVSVVDDEAIRKAYQGVSNSAQLWAQTVGLQDQREAENLADEFLYSSQTSPIMRSFSTASLPATLQPSISKKSSCSSLPARRRLSTGVVALLHVQAKRAIRCYPSKPSP
jgi:hypothetical protein